MASSGIASTPPVGGSVGVWNTHVLKSSHGGPGSDSGSSGNSSDCLGGSSSSSEETSAAGMIGKPASKVALNAGPSGGVAGAEPAGACP